MGKKELVDNLDSFIEGLELEELAPKTISSYKNAINKLINYLKDNQKINKKVIMSWKKDLKDKNYALKSRNQFIVVINKYLAYLGLTDCMVKQFEEQEKSSLEDYIEPQEHKRMLRWAKQMNMLEAYYIMKVFASSGARISELQYFTVENLESNYIKGAYNKHKERTLIMTNDLRRELKKYCKINKITTGYIFRSPDPKLNSNPDKMVNQSTIWRWLKKIAKKAKINAKKMHPHAWRHLFAKQCKANGIDLDELADILGHKNLNTTAIYTKTSMKEKKNKLERIKY
jgi:site-specific recombinase XerD